VLSLFEKKYIVVGFLWLFAEFSAGQVAGVVVNKEQEPIEAVQVLVVGSERGTVSDESGVFSLRVTENEVLEFSHVSYETAYITIGKQFPDTVILRDEINTLDEIEVMPFQTTDVVRISSKTIETLPVLLGERDILKYAATLPGIKSLSALDAGIYVRGGSGFDNAFYVNDINIANPRHVTGVLSIYDPYVLSYSEIYKSGFSAKYNGSLASYINMQPTGYIPEVYSGEVSLGLLASSLRSKLKMGKDKKTVAALSFRNSYFQYAGKIINENREDNKIPEYSFKDLTFSLTSPINDKWDLQIFGMATADDLPLMIGERTQHNLNWDSQSFVVKSLRKLGNEKNLTISAGGYQFHSEASSRSRVDLSSSGHNNKYSFNTLYQNSSGRLFDYSFGISAVYSDFRYTSREDDTKAHQNSFNYHLLNSFARINNALSEKLNLELGLNGGLYKQSMTQLTLDPRVKLIYEGRAHKIWLDYARTHQYERNLQVFTISSPVDLQIPIKEKAPTSDQLSGGISLSHERQWLFSGALFYKRLSHIKDFARIDLTNLSGDDMEMLSGKGQAMGTELGFEYRFRPVAVRANYTLSDVEHQFEGINDGRSFSPPYDIRHDFFANIVVQINRSLMFTASWEYKSGVVVTFPVGVAVTKDLFDKENALKMIPVYKDRHNYRLKPTHRLDVTMRWEKQLRKDVLKLDFGIYNAYNQANDSFVYIEPVRKDDYYIRFEPRSKVLLPFMPFLSVTYCLN
jgi:hypothetical protein